MSRADYLDMIQRELDGDLSPVEQADLERKLATDPELQLIHSRLSHVSSRLEQLPQVTPPFSIVDSILPQLDISSPEPVQTEAQPQIRELPRLERKMDREPEEKPRKIPSWMLKASSGVVAASLLFGLYAMAHPAKPALEPDQTNGSASVPTETNTTKPNSTQAKEQVVDNKTPTTTDHSQDPGQSADPSGKQQTTVNQAQDPAVATKDNQGKNGSSLNPSPYLSPSKRATATYSEKDKKKNEKQDKEKDNEMDKEKNESIVNNEKKKTAASSNASPARDAESNSKTNGTTESRKNEKDKEKGYEKDKNNKQKSNDD